MIKRDHASYFPSLFRIADSGINKLSICTLLLVASIAQGAPVSLAAVDDATVYDLPPSNGVVDLIESWQPSLEVGEAYDYYRDGRIAKGLLLFDISTLGKPTISSASFFTTVWSWRIGSSFEVLGFHADPSLRIEDWDTAASFVGQSGTVDNQPALVPFEFDVTALLRTAIASDWQYLGIRLEEGGSSQMVDPAHVGFIGTKWAPSGLITYPYHYPRITIAEIPEPDSVLMTVSGLSVLGMLFLKRSSRRPA